MFAIFKILEFCIERCLRPNKFDLNRFVYAVMIAHLSYDMMTQDQKLLFNSFPPGLMPLIAAIFTTTNEGFSLDRAATCAQISIHTILIPVLMVLFSFGLPRVIFALVGAPNAASNYC